MWQGFFGSLLNVEETDDEEIGILRMEAAGCVLVYLSRQPGISNLRTERHQRLYGEEFASRPYRARPGLFALHADGGAARTGGGGPGQPHRRPQDATDWKLLRDAGRAFHGAVRSNRLASCNLFRNPDWIRVLRGRSHCRAAGHRAMVRSQTRAGAFAHV